MPQVGMPQVYMPQPQIPYVAQPATPQMPYVAQPPMPQMPYVTPPQVVVPAVAVPAPKSSNTLLIVIFCLLAFLAGAIIVYLLVRPR
jgi:hypothetical protein